MIITVSMSEDLSPLLPPPPCEIPAASDDAYDDDNNGPLMTGLG